jgi:hypothetical protein
LFAAGVLSFYLTNPNESSEIKKENSEIAHEGFFNKIGKLFKEIKNKAVAFFSYISKAFAYAKDFIIKVILPRLSMEQRSKFYSTIRFFSRLKYFLFSKYYLFLCAVALLIIYHHGRKLLKS